jgi:hypothetical protein
VDSLLSRCWPRVLCLSTNGAIVTDLKPEETAALRRWWFNSVYQISDLELQRRTWLDPANRNPHWSYVEFVCSFPDDDQLDDAKRRGFLSVEEHAILIDLNRALVLHKAPGGDDYDNAAVLDDPAWHAVAAQAAAARQRLLELTTDSFEREALSGPA